MTSSYRLTPAPPRPAPADVDELRAMYTLGFPRPCSWPSAPPRAGHGVDAQREVGLNVRTCIVSEGMSASAMRCASISLF